MACPFEGAQTLGKGWVCTVNPPPYPGGLQTSSAMAAAHETAGAELASRRLLGGRREAPCGKQVGVTWPQTDAGSRSASSTGFGKRLPPQTPVLDGPEPSCVPRGRGPSYT